MVRLAGNCRCRFSRNSKDNNEPVQTLLSNPDRNIQDHDDRSESRQDKAAGMEGNLNLKQFKFKMKNKQIEPLVKPADPEVIPHPETVPKKEPDEDSPWNVPGPKVDPTPKGKYIF